MSVVRERVRARGRGHGAGRPAPVWRRKEKRAMAGKIFYRERTKAKEGEKKPRYLLVAVAGIDLKFHAKHVRRNELEAIALEVGAELVQLGRDEHGAYGDEEVEIK
jgi:hypothetical protein